MDQESFFAETFPVSETGCWFWMRALTSQGYGVLWFRGISHCQAHRASWEIFRGEIPAGLCVCHKCDIKCCVNPDHLFLGTSGDNSRDRTLKQLFRDRQVGVFRARHWNIPPDYDNGWNPGPNITYEEWTRLYWTHTYSVPNRKQQ